MIAIVVGIQKSDLGGVLFPSRWLLPTAISAGLLAGCGWLTAAGLQALLDLLPSSSASSMAPLSTKEPVRGSPYVFYHTQPSMSKQKTYNPVCVA